MTELSFLLDLLLNHDLQKQTRDFVATRIKEVEAILNAGPVYAQIPPSAAAAMSNRAERIVQAPSTLALMAKHGEIPTITTHDPEPSHQPVQFIAQTPAAAAAMESRNIAIAESLAQKVNKATGRPRKW